MATIQEIADLIIKDAQRRADEITKATAAETEKTIENMRKEHSLKLAALDAEKTEKENVIEKKLHYDCQVVNSNAQSLAKAEFFEEIITAAEEAIVNMPQDDYCLFIKKMITVKKPPAGAEVAFGKKDIKRLSKAFFKEISKSYGIQISESKEDYGFIINALTYRDIVTPHSIIEDKKPELMQILGRYEASL